MRECVCVCGVLFEVFVCFVVYVFVGVVVFVCCVVCAAPPLPAHSPQLALDIDDYVDTEEGAGATAALTARAEGWSH